MKLKKYDDVQTYVADFPEGVREKLERMREIIQHTAPKAQEVISYGMPAYKMNSVLVYFAAFKNHIGFFPTASGIKAFQHKIEKYKWSKGTIQFPLDQPLPEKLIKAIVRFRVKEDKQKSKVKKSDVQPNVRRA